MSKDFTRRMALKIFFQMDDIYEDIVRVGNNLDTLNIKREEIQDRNQPTQLIQSSPMQPIPMPVSTPRTKIPVILSNLCFLLETFFWFRRRKNVNSD